MESFNKNKDQAKQILYKDHISNISQDKEQSNSYIEFDSTKMINPFLNQVPL